MDLEKTGLYLSKKLNAFIDFQGDNYLFAGKTIQYGNVEVIHFMTIRKSGDCIVQTTIPLLNDDDRNYEIVNDLNHKLDGRFNFKISDSKLIATTSNLNYISISQEDMLNMFITFDSLLLEDDEYLELLNKLTGLKRED